MTRIATMPSMAADTDARVVAHNLPVQLTSFIGRDTEIAQLRALLSGSRLVTLTGAGGVGKTRLALQVAAGILAEFPAGVWLVELAPLTDPGLIPVTVARALGLQDAPGLSPVATVTGFIGRRRALIVLDNCEHLLDDCAALAEELLRACPALVVLATSREPVGAAGEATWLVPSLPVDGAAVDLFADRGRNARPDFEITPENTAAVAEVCRRLDGIPLAIELAAARLRAFSPGEIAAGLHDRFRLLTGGSRTAARRQQTLRASVDWSHALLTDSERILFRRLAAFAGGFDLTAAEAVSAGESLRLEDVLHLLALLVDKSLVGVDESAGATRYRLLETVRQYAAEKLADSGEADQVRTRHRDHYAAVASRLDQSAGRDLGGQLGRLEDDIDNLRAAFAWSMELSDTEFALRLTSSLQPLWRRRFRQVEGLAWFDAALNDQLAGGEPVAPSVRVQAVADAAVLDGYTDTPSRRQAQIGEAVALARQLGDSALLGRVLLGAGIAAGWLAEDGRPYLAEATVLARQAGDTSTLGRILYLQAYEAFNSGDLVVSRTAGEEGLALAEQAGDDHDAQMCRIWLGAALVLQGDLRRGTSLFNRVIAEADEERLPMCKIWALGMGGWARAFMGQSADAHSAGQASIAMASESGRALWAMSGYFCLVLAAQASGDVRALRAASQAFWQSSGCRPEFAPEHHSHMAEADLATGELCDAREHADLAIAEAARLGLKFPLMLELLAGARVAAAANDRDRARDEAVQALSIGPEVQSQIGIIDALECLGALPRFAEEQRKAARLLGAADALRRVIGYRRFLLRQPAYDAAVAELRTSMGDGAFDQAWSEGAALSPDDAVSYALRGRGERKRPDFGWLSLTPAERDVARLVAEGLANKEIAAGLFVSPRTVQTHLTHIYGKLGVTSRVQLAQQAARQAADS